MRLHAGLFSLSVLTLTLALASCGELIGPKETEQVAAPSFGIAAGPTPGLTLTTTTPGATIRYTIDGTTPSASVGTVYSVPLVFTVTTTVKAIAIKSGWKNSRVVSQTYTVDPPAEIVATPVASPEPGSYASAQTVTLSSSTAGAQIYYTTNDSTPSPTNGTLYQSALTLSSDTVLRAVAVKSGWEDSSEFWGQYFFTPTLNTPTISPNGGVFTEAQTVTLSSDATGFFEIYYTVNGTEPSETNGTFYDGPFEVSATSTVKAIVVKPNWNNSPVASASFTINLPQTVATPTISPNGGTFTSAQSVTLVSTTSGVSIYYTTNGDTPTASSTYYNGAFPVAASATVKAIAIKSGWTDSQVASASFTINTSGTGGIAVTVQ